MLEIFLRSIFLGGGHEIKGGEICFSREIKEWRKGLLESGETKERRKLPQIIIH